MSRRCVRDERMNWSCRTSVDGRSGYVPLYCLYLWDYVVHLLRSVSGSM